MDFNFFVKDANLPFRLVALCRNPCRQRILSFFLPSTLADSQTSTVKVEKIRVCYYRHRITD
jgi:hypothetical protein